MSIKRFAFLILVFLMPAGGVFAVSPNTGFVSDKIWFSEETINEGDNVKIYTAVFNGEEKAVKFSINFLNGDTILSKKDVSVASGETKTVSADFKAVLGHHDLFAESIKASMGEEEIILEKNKTEKTKISIVKDVPVTVAKDALVGNLSSAFSEETLSKFGFWFNEHFKQSEEFRYKKLQNFKDQKEEISEKREKSKDVKTQTKVLMFLHFSLFAVLVFIFSIQFVFYALVVVLSYILIRWVFRIIIRLFRRRHDEE